MKFWVLNQRWTKRFFLSHIFGWITATIQTLWIVFEIRYFAKKILKVIERK